MKKLFLITIIVFSSLFVLTIAGCAANGPLLKPSQKTRSQYVERYSELTAEIKQAILRGKVIEGMTKEDVMASWGRPSETDDFSANSKAWWYEPDGEGWWYKPFPISLEPTRFVKFKEGIVVYFSENYK